jgi:hypothetical protein
MALSYSAILRVPQAYTVLGLDRTDLWEFQAGGSSGFASIIDVLNNEKALLEGYYGGTFSWVISADATYDIYTISWTGLTADPATDPDLITSNILGNPVALYISGFVSGDIVSTSFFSTEQCEATGSCTPCPPSVNPDDATDCLSCYPLEIEFCASTFDIEGLEADTEYTIKIKDNVSNKTYDYVATSDQYGIIEITTANYPTGVFTPFNSPLSITILDEKGDPVILTYGYVNYSCLELNVTNTTTIV